MRLISGGVGVEAYLDFCWLYITTTKITFLDGQTWQEKSQKLSGKVLPTVDDSKLLGIGIYWHFVQTTGETILYSETLAEIARTPSGFP